MKREMMFFAFLVVFASAAVQLRAQETPAAEAARQQAEEERYKHLSGDIEDLKTANQSFQHRLNEQREEIRRLSEELARANANNNKDVATREDLKHLADKIKEVDEKRMEDNEKIRAELIHLGKTLAAPPKSSSPGPSPIKPTVEPKSGGEKGFEYMIRAGDNPSVIAKALAKQGMKITSKQIIDANPAVDWQKLQVKQKIFIPAPTQ